MSLVLVIDASLVGVQLALVAPGAGGPDAAVVAWRGAHLANAGSIQAIGTLLEDGLRATGAAAADVAALAVSTGPGSFTGIKVGLAFAYGFAAGRPGLKVAGVSALQAGADALRRERGVDRLALYLGATRTHGFEARAAADGSARQVLASTEPGGLEALPAGTLAVIASGWTAMEELLRSRGAALEVVSPEILCERALSGLIREAARLWPAGYGEELPPPRYLRLSTAEERLGRAASIV